MFGGWVVRDDNGGSTRATAHDDQAPADPSVTHHGAAPTAGAWFMRHKRGTGLAAAGVVVTGVAAVGVTTGSALVQPTAFEAPGGTTVAATETIAEPVVEELDFPPIEVSGSGSATAPIGLPQRPAEAPGPVLPRSERVVISITHDGTSNFAVWSLDGDGQRGELLVNVIGTYTGTSTLPAESTALAIEADGGWTATVSPMTSVPSFTEATDGTGDAVVRYDGEAGPLEIQHLGDAVFAVVAHLPDGTSDLLINDLGEFEGRIEVPAGTLLDITADGPWSATAG